MTAVLVALAGMALLAVALVGPFRRALAPWQCWDVSCKLGQYDREGHRTAGGCVPISRERWNVEPVAVGDPINLASVGTLNGMRVVASPNVPNDMRLFGMTNEDGSMTLFGHPDTVAHVHDRPESAPWADPLRYDGDWQPLDSDPVVR